MGDDYNINITWGEKGTTGSYGGGNALHNKGGSNKNMRLLTKRNMIGFAGFGMALRYGQKANDIIGQYTGNTLRQRRTQVGLTFAKYAVGIGYFGPLGIAYMAGDIASKSISYGIDIQKKNREADYYRRLSGNNAFSGSRYRGDYS